MIRILTSAPFLRHTQMYQHSPIDIVSGLVEGPFWSVELLPLLLLSQVLLPSWMMPFYLKVFLLSDFWIPWSTPSQKHSMISPLVTILDVVPPVSMWVLGWHLLFCHRYWLEPFLQVTEGWDPGKHSVNFCLERRTSWLWNNLQWPASVLLTLENS